MNWFIQNAPRWGAIQEPINEKEESNKYEVFSNSYI